MSSTSGRFSSLRLVGLVLFLALVIGLSAILSMARNTYYYLGAGLLAIPVFLLWVKKPVLSLYLFIFVCFIPQGLIPTSYYDYVYRLLALVVFGLWIFDAISHREKLKFPITSLLMGCFLLWSSVTLVWTSNVGIGVSFLQIYLVRFIIFLIVLPNLLQSPKNLAGFMNTLALSAWVIVLATLFTVILNGYFPGMRLKVFGENENSLGIHILVTMVGVLWKATQPSKLRLPIWKWLAYLYLLAAIGVVAVSGSRGSAISLLVAFLAFWLWKETRIFGKVSVIYLVIIGAMLPLLFQTVIERFTIIDQFNTLLGGREALWSAAWTAIQNNPLLGIGLGNSNYVMLSYLQDYRSILGLEYAPVHNPVLTIWMETGLPGLLFYLATLASALLIFIRQYLRDIQDNGSQFTPYYGIVAAVFLGYMLSWIKGGGIESDVTYFLVLALLVLPSALHHRLPAATVQNTHA